MKRLFVIIAMTVWAFAAAAETGHKHRSVYAGQENREIKSLSASDIEELRRGGGWGLAKAAELNGVPGPAHLLQMKDAINLSDAQVLAIADIHARMKARAMAEGARLIQLERRLERHFRQGTITDQILRDSLSAIEGVRKQLRYTHLATHLKTPDILSAAQVETYNRLRGYTASAACDAVPQGHNAEQWRRHNSCN